MRLIDADALTKRLKGVLDMVKNEPNQTYANAIRVIIRDVALAHTIDAEPVRHAAWQYEISLDVAADLIESLSAELEQVKRERDAAVEDLGEFCYDLCKVCMYSSVDITNEPCKSCDAVINKGNWQWRGVKEDT